MAKDQPMWRQLGLPEQPPPDEFGYVNYGTIYDPAVHGRPGRIENLRTSWRWAIYSYRSWGRKIRKQIRWWITQKTGR